MITKWTKTYITIFFLGLVLLPSTFTRAASHYTVTPRVIDVEAQARDIIARTITITNNANYTSSIFPSVNEISLDAGGDIAEFKGPTMVDRPAAITSWLEVPRQEINIPAGGSYELPITIRMNPNTVPGEYHALIGFGSGRNRDEAEKLVVDGRAPGVVVTIRVADTAVERMDLRGFSIEKFVTSATNQAVSYTLTNPGDTTVVPQGEIIFYDSNGKEVGSIPANPEGVALTPGEEVELNATVPTKGLIGQYKGFLNVNYGSGQTAAVYDTAFFYILPWQKLLILFGLVLGFALLLTLYIHRRYGSVDDDDVHHLSFHLKNDSSTEKDHDINLKQIR